MAKEDIVPLLAGSPADGALLAIDYVVNKDEAPTTPCGELGQLAAAALAAPPIGGGSAGGGGLVGSVAAFAAGVLLAAAFFGRGRA